MKFKNVKPGQIFSTIINGQEILFAKLQRDVAWKTCSCVSCFDWSWNATNFKNLIHFCPESEIHEIFDYFIATGKHK